MKLGSVAVATIIGTGVLLWWRSLQRRERIIDFTSRSVVITGGSRGLGLAIAREFATGGARLTLLARDRAELDRARNDIKSLGAEVLTLVCDVRQKDQVDAAIDQAIRHYGRIDVLVNNAGVTYVGPQEHMRIEDYEDAMATHMWGPLYTMRATIPHMRQRGGGRIVNIASIGGKLPIPHLAPYVASKFALVGFSQTMRAELLKDGIIVTTVSPMTMRTGSQYNVFYKGRRGSEMNWFAVLDALPFTSVDARVAARLIVEACQRGDPELFIIPTARYAVVLAQLFPGFVAQLLNFVNQILPAPTSLDGNESRLGWNVKTPLVPSTLTQLSDHATRELNGLAGHSPVVREQKVRNA